jgi:hypothetical protein
VLVGMSKSEVPHSSAELRSDDPLVREQALQREKSLLYVAASRARDELYVFAAGTLSPLISAWAGERTSGPATPKKRNPKVARAESAEVTRNPKVADPMRNPEVAHAMDGEAIRNPEVAEPMRNPEVADPADEALARVLASRLDSLELTTRMASFAQREGLVTLGDLARLSPYELMSKPNLGRLTMSKTRQLIEDLTGRSWESLNAFTAEATAEKAGVFSAGMDWDAMRLALSPEQATTRLENMEISARIRHFAEKRALLTLGELATVSTSELSAADNVGRGSIKQLPSSVWEHFQKARSTSPSGAGEAAVDSESEGLLELWKAMLERLEGVPRIVLTRRSGLGGASETLREIGEMLGVSRERIRQIESDSINRLARRGWTHTLLPRIESALAEGAASLRELGAERWWSAAAAQPEVMRYLVEDVIKTDAFVVELDGMDWLSRAPANIIKTAWASVRNEAEAVPLPAPREAFDAIALASEGTVGRRLASQFAKMLRDTFHYASEAPDAQVVAMGENRVARLMALLRKSPEPIHTEEVEAVLGGRTYLPEEVVRFGGGRIGLRSHIPDFDVWKMRLVPVCVSIIERVDPERQWSCTELHDELREEFELPAWLNPFVLSAFIRAGDELNSLGRLRVALPGKGENESRIYLHDLMEKLLREAGRPMEREVLVEQINARMGISEFAMIQCFTRPQFVRLDGLHYGLTDRDVPGGAVAIAEVRDELASVLERRGRGLSLFHAHEHVIMLSSTHASWTHELVYSVLHGDPRFRFTQSGAVGLSTWDSVGVPTRLELVRSALEKSEGRVSVDAVVALIQAHYGETVGRGTVGAIAMKVGAYLSGDWVVAKG